MRLEHPLVPDAPRRRLLSRCDYCLSVSTITMPLSTITTTPYQICSTARLLLPQSEGDDGPRAAEEPRAGLPPEGQIDGFFSQLPYKCYQNPGIG